MSGSRWQLRATTLAAITLGLVLAPRPASARRPELAADTVVERTDVVVYGGTAGGVIAAVQARRMGHGVVLVEPGRRLGGLTSGGLGNTDIGNKGAIGGLSRRFYERVAAHYARPEAWLQETRAEYERRSALRNQGHGRPDPLAARTGVPTMWVFEPAVAERVLRAMAEEAGVALRFGQRLELTGGVEKDGAAVRSIRMESGEVYAARVFVDATYEGDLMAKAGVSYHVGREANAVYGETLNGVQTRQATSHQFKLRVDPFVSPGDPASGLLPGIHAGGPGAEGTGDARVQAYNFRLTLTDAESNRLPLPRPEGYSAQRYELLRRYLAAGVFDALDANDPMPNRKTDVNNNGAFSSDHIGASGHFTPQLYVREARRMVGALVMTEQNCRGSRRAEDPVGLAAYGMDSHNVQRYVQDGAARNEGDVQVAVAGPYPVSYRAIVPKRGEATNLLVPVALSASHIAYGSIRMEPVFMILGQSAGTAAALAVEGDGDVQDVPYARLRERLQRDGQILDWPPPATSR
jgi:hypothetical protein